MTAVSEKADIVRKEVEVNDSIVQCIWLTDFEGIVKLIVVCFERYMVRHEIVK
jgi:hypothetical protein